MHGVNFWSHTQAMLMRCIVVHCNTQDSECLACTDGHCEGIVLKLGILLAQRGHNTLAIGITTINLVPGSLWHLAGVGKRPGHHCSCFTPPKLGRILNALHRSHTSCAYSCELELIYTTYNLTLIYNILSYHAPSPPPTPPTCIHSNIVIHCIYNI